MVVIASLSEDTPDELSDGQQQRIALGHAIVRDPEVFLINEPLSNLNAKPWAQMRTELQNLAGRSRRDHGLHDPQPDGSDDDGIASRS